MFHRFTLKGSTDLIPKERVCCAAAIVREELWRHGRESRRKDGGSGMATRIFVLGGILVSACGGGSCDTAVYSRLTAVLMVVDLMVLLVKCIEVQPSL